MRVKGLYDSDAAKDEIVIFDPAVASEITALQDRALKQMEAAGVPQTWDDVANTRPDLFIPGTRQIEAPAFSDEALR